MGIVLIAFGVFILILGKLLSVVPLGKLPGDIEIKRENFVFYFPLGTSLLLSVLLSLLFSLIAFIFTRKM
jgi:hypothetical protein